MVRSTTFLGIDDISNDGGTVLILTEYSILLNEAGSLDASDEKALRILCDLLGTPGDIVPHPSEVWSAAVQMVGDTQGNAAVLRTQIIVSELLLTANLQP